MKTTLHFQQRMNQRGISKDMIEVVLEHGISANDQYILDRDHAQKVLDEVRRQERLLLKVIDKGGVVVVAADGHLITTYNCSGRRG
jgi:hypothetical protein